MAKQKFAFDGATALVTGASSGIGHATARALAARGVRVAISARRTNKLEELADQVEKEGRHRPVVLTADLSERGQAAALAAQTLAALGGVDLLVNNAALHVLDPLVDTDDDQARAIYEANVWTPLTLAKELIPALERSSRGGAIATVTSAAAYMAPDLHGIYASSKAATVLVTDVLRIELRKKSVSVTEVVPGPVETTMLAASKTAPWAERALKVLPPGTPEGMARVLLDGVEHRKRRVSYPWHTSAVVHFPGFGKALTRTLAEVTSP